MNPSIRARDFQTGRWINLLIENRQIAAVDRLESTPSSSSPDDLFIAPAFWDLQTNGRWCVSYSSPDLSTLQVAEIVRAQGPLGTARLCPTLISAPTESFLHGLSTIARACDEDRDIARRVVGIHLEGPYLSSLEGYRGAHPLSALRDPSWPEFERFQQAAGGRIVLTTLAPERSGAIPFIRKAVASGVRVALGHTAADAPTLRAAVDAGATLSTHLGNGVASTLPRHPNPIWEQAALDRLAASLIADGHHLDPSTLRVLLRAKTSSRIILVSDASPLAGMPPGRYGAWEVHASGKIIVTDTPYLAGSNQSLETGINNLLSLGDLSISEAIATVTTNPARLLGHPAPSLEPGRPANLVLFHQSTTRPTPAIRLAQTCVDGRWISAVDDAPSPWS